MLGQWIRKWEMRWADLKTAIKSIQHSLDCINDDVRFLILAKHLPHGIVYFTITKEGLFIMTTITAPDINASQTLTFGLAGSVPPGQTFSEPIVLLAPTNAGNLNVQLSIRNSDGSFTTAGTFTPAAGYLGPVTLSAEVLGVDDQDANFNVVPVPSPETVAFVSSSFSVSSTGAAPSSTVPSTTGSAASDSSSTGSASTSGSSSSGSVSTSGTGSVGGTATATGTAASNVGTDAATGGPSVTGTESAGNPNVGISQPPTGSTT
jgi:hypothetical protein